MPDPLRFNSVLAAVLSQPYASIVEEMILVYRFADWDKRFTCQSYRQQAGQPEPQPAENLDSYALSHTKSAKSETRGMKSPFVSVVTSHRRLVARSEGDALRSIQGSPHLITFNVPANRLCLPLAYANRGGLQLMASRMDDGDHLMSAEAWRGRYLGNTTVSETEWLFYDYPESLTQFYFRHQDNPYR